MAIWSSLSSGLVTTMEVSGVTKWYLRDRSRAWAVRFSFSSPLAFLLWGGEGRVSPENSSPHAFPALSPHTRPRAPEAVWGGPLPRVEPASTQKKPVHQFPGTDG